MNDFAVIDPPHDMNPAEAGVRGPVDRLDREGV